MGRQEVEAYLLPRMAFQDVPHREEVAGRLGHLGPLHLQHAVVDPVKGEGFSVGRLRLQDLVLVVWEYEVIAAAMDVDRFTKMPGAHGRAFDVPSRAALAPRGVP